MSDPLAIGTDIALYSRDRLVEVKEKERMRDDRYKEILEDEEDLACILQDNFRDFAPVLKRMIKAYIEDRSITPSAVEFIELADRLSAEEANRILEL